MMKLIICTSHLYIPVTLDLIHGEIENSSVYTDRESISFFLNKMYPELDVFLLKRQRNRRFIDKYFTDVKKQKCTLRKHYETKNIKEVWFFHEGFCKEANWLIQYLWKKQRPEITYMPVERTFDNTQVWKEVNDVKHLLLKTLCYLNWGYHVHYYSFFNDAYPVMDESFFSSVHSREVPVHYNKQSILSDIDRILINPIKIPYNGVLWLENTLRDFKVKWDKSSYEVFISSTFSRLNVEMLFFKGHPDMSLKYGKEEKLVEIPSFIPGNILLSRFSCFVGPISDLMYEAAKAGTLTISTLYLFDINEEDRELMVDYLKKGSSEIKFPKTIEDFIKLLSTANIRR